jgi:uncharacterized protein YkwD
MYSKVSIIIINIILVTAAILTVQSSPSSMLQPSYAQSCPDGSTPDASGNCPTDAPPPAGDGETAQAPPPATTETPPPATEAPPATTETPPPATEAPPATTETPDTGYGAYGTKEAYCEVYRTDAECQEAPPPSRCQELSMYECNALTTTPSVVDNSSAAYLAGYQSALLYSSGNCQSFSNTPRSDSQNRSEQDDCSIGYVDGITAMQNPTFQQSADFVRGMLELHNRERAAVGSPPIVWSDRLAAESKAWAEHLSPTGQLVHDYGNVEGENIADDIASVPKLWVNEKNQIPQKYQGGPITQFYESLSQNDQFAAGHYFAMVDPTWKAVGCGTAGNPYPIVVCRYTVHGAEQGSGGDPDPRFESGQP